MSTTVPSSKFPPLFFLLLFFCSHLLSPSIPLLPFFLPFFHPPLIASCIPVSSISTTSSKFPLLFFLLFCFPSVPHDYHLPFLFSRSPAPTSHSLSSHPSHLPHSPSPFFLPLLPSLIPLLFTCYLYVPSPSPFPLTCRDSSTMREWMVMDTFTFVGSGSIQRNVLMDRERWRVSVDVLVSWIVSGSVLTFITGR